MNNDNDNDKVINFGTKKSEKESASAPPEPRTFRVTQQINGELITSEITGFLVATPSFVGIGTLDGTIVAIFPFANLFNVVEQSASVPANAA